MSGDRPGGPQRRGVEALDVWWRAKELVALVYQIALAMPPIERYGIADQLRGSSVSIIANLAEGHARLGRAEYRHHVSIALGSAGELKTLLQLCMELNLGKRDDVVAALAKAESVASMLWKLAAALKRD